MSWFQMSLGVIGFWRAVKVLLDKILLCDNLAGRPTSYLRIFLLYHNMNLLFVVFVSDNDIVLVGLIV